MRLAGARRERGAVLLGSWWGPAAVESSIVVEASAGNRQWRGMAPKNIGAPHTESSIAAAVGTTATTTVTATAPTAATCATTTDTSKSTVAATAANCDTGG